MNKVKIGAIGEQDVMLIFKAAGADVFPVLNAEEAEQTLKKIANDNYGIIFITDNIASKIDSAIMEYSDKMLPSIMVIPGLGEESDYAINRLRHAIIKAVGADIIAQKQ